MEEINETFVARNEDQAMEGQRNETETFVARIPEGADQMNKTLTTRISDPVHNKMKEKFMARISDMTANQAKNTKMMSDETYTNIIRKLKLLNDKPEGYHLQLESKNY